MLEDAKRESERWSQIALEQKGVVRDTEARLQRTEQRLQTLELRANGEFDKLRAAVDACRREHEAAESSELKARGWLTR